jgi:YesN/AraC family two-component response regulator
MLLPSLDAKYVSRCAELGLKHYLAMPVQESELLHLIEKVVSQKHETSGHKAFSQNREDGPSLCVLLAEDNEVNQKVAMGFL